MGRLSDNIEQPEKVYRDFHKETYNVTHRGLLF